MKNERTGKRSGKRTTQGQGSKQDTVVTMTLDEARQRAARGESRTDWAALDAMTDADIERAIDSDPDAAPRLDAMFFQTAQLLTRAANAEKTTVTLRIDTDVLNAIKQQGSGYQSRINAVLRAWVEARHPH